MLTPLPASGSRAQWGCYDNNAFSPVGVRGLGRLKIRVLTPQGWWPFFSLSAVAPLTRSSDGLHWRPRPTLCFDNHSLLSRFGPSFWYGDLWA
jgi:hypothetical protein